MLTKVTQSGRGQSPQPPFIRVAKGGSLEGEISEMLLIVRKLYQLKQSSSEQGFTLLEALVAILIIAIAIAVIAPPILLSAATRVQNQRVEQATQIARGEMNRIKFLVERGNYQIAELPPLTASDPIKDTAVPEANPKSSSTVSRTATQGYFIYIDSDRNPNTPPEPEFVVQTFYGKEQTVRVTRSGSPIDIPVAFMMGVRVYSARAFAGGARPTLTDPISLGFTSGVNLQRPLAVLYTPIVRSDQRFSLCKYHKFLTPGANCTE